MTTGPGTGRLSTSETARMALSALVKAERQSYVGITEERVGSLVVPLLRIELPRGEEYATTEDAFVAMLDFHSRFKMYRDAPADNLVSALASSVEKREGK